MRCSSECPTGSRQGSRSSRAALPGARELTDRGCTRRGRAGVAKLVHPIRPRAGARSRCWLLTMPASVSREPCPVQDVFTQARPRLPGGKEPAIRSRTTPLGRAPSRRPGQWLGREERSVEHDPVDRRVRDALRWRLRQPRVECPHREVRAPSNPISRAPIGRRHGGSARSPAIPGSASQVAPTPALGRPPPRTGSPPSGTQALDRLAATRRRRRTSSPGIPSTPFSKLNLRK